MLEKDKKRGKRRYQKIVANNKTKGIMKQWHSNITDEKELEEILNKRSIGINAKTPARCSRFCCGNPRKHFNELTLQEIKNLYNFNEGLEEIEIEELLKEIEEN